MNDEPNQLMTPQEHLAASLRECSRTPEYSEAMSKYKGDHIAHPDDCYGVLAKYLIDHADDSVRHVVISRKLIPGLRGVNAELRPLGVRLILEVGDIGSTSPYELHTMYLETLLD